MSRMSDIMEMVKQGFSISDIKEVYQIAKETNGSEETGTETKDKNTEEKETGAAAANADDTEITQGSDQETDSKGEDQTDYKKKYHELLKKYQQENIHADNSDKDVRTVEEKASDILAEMFGGKKDA